MNPIIIKNVKIGEGVPKVCLPIVGHTQYEIVSQAMTIASLKPDIVEFRVDWYDAFFEEKNILDMLKQVRKLIGNIPLLYTFRRIEEGGLQKITKSHYIEINKFAIESGLIDMVDIELMSGDETVKEIINCAKENGVVVVCSNHDFEMTPSINELLKRLEKMVEIGADIPKIAMMPVENKDVLTLLEVTDIFHKKHPDIPFITMSMGGKGVISRLAGEIFGSAVTFGCARKQSAPGQIEADELARALHIVHNNLYNKDF
ncbi:MAG: type I 3-dehydroquinate dehydratase [Lachnospirales bacterium]